MNNKTLRAYIDGIVNQAVVAIGNAQDQLMFNVRMTLDALASKADETHTHTVDQLTDLSRTYLAQDIHWNANTNTPRLADPTTCKGQFYIVSEPGTRKLGTVTYQFRKDDWVLSTGTEWVHVAHSLPPEVMRTDVAMTRTAGMGEVSVNDGSVLTGVYTPDLTKGSTHEVHLTGDVVLTLPTLPRGTECGTIVIYTTVDLSVGTIVVTPAQGYRIMQSAGGLEPIWGNITMTAGTTYLLELLVRKPDAVYIRITALTDV